MKERIIREASVQSILYIYMLHWIGIFDKNFQKKGYKNFSSLLLLEKYINEKNISSEEIQVFDFFMWM